METATFDLVALQGPGCTRRVLDLPCAAILAEIPRPHLGPGCRFGLRLRLRRLLDGVGGRGVLYSGSVFMEFCLGILFGGEWVERAEKGQKGAQSIRTGPTSLMMRSRCGRVSN